MQLIAQNAQYRLAYCAKKNRVYLTIKGFWQDTQQVPYYLADWRTVLKLAKPGFTVLSDARTMRTHPTEVAQLHETVQRLVNQAGVGQVAKVMPQDDFADLQCDTMLRRNQLPAEKFTTEQEAETWLDALQRSYYAASEK